MNLRTITAATGLVVASLAFTASPAAATATASFAVVDAGGAPRGTVTADSGLVNVCDWQADGVQVSVEYALADGTTNRRIAPVGGCTPAFASGITAVRGFAGDFANDWVAV
jgi:hypothetical protein